MGIHDGHREKMRRRFLQGGLDTFADHEALELLLFYAIPRRDTITRPPGTLYLTAFSIKLKAI